MQPSASQISELREHFLRKVAEEHAEAAIHPADFERVKSSDDWLRRYLLHHDCDMSLAQKMLWDTCEWRKQFGTNELSESNVRVDYLSDGTLFSHGKDIDGSTLLIFKCKLHVKGQREMEDLKKCVVYWLERLERQDNGKPITVFFDMDGCGLSNMDMEYTKYLINLLKMYYPFFLNYIIIYEMAWILNAAFRIIKALLPEKAVAKMKFLSKSTVKEFVPLDQALSCWGGEDNYTFTFVPEVRQAAIPVVTNNKKVHFADGSPMSDNAGGFGDKESDGVLSVSPSSCITFIKDGNELTSTVLLLNTENEMCISYKMKTTSPEKFRVRPSAGCLAPGQQGSVSVTLLPGFQLGGLSRDKFLVMSMPIDSVDMSPQDLAELWKNASGKNISQHKLRCSQPAEMAKNGSAVGASSLDTDQNQIANLASRVSQLTQCQSQLHNSMQKMYYLQIFTLILMVVMAIVVVYVLRSDIHEYAPLQECPFKQV